MADPTLPRIAYRPESRDELLEALTALQRVVLEHPVASRQAFTALVHEGRRFAQTQEGARLADQVQGSELLARAHLVFDNASLWLLEEGPERILPSGLVDALAAAAASDDRELLLDQLFRGLGGPR